LRCFLLGTRFTFSTPSQHFKFDKRVDLAESSKSSPIQFDAKHTAKESHVSPEACDASLTAKRDETAIETHLLPHLLNLPLICSKIGKTNLVPTGQVATVGFEQAILLLGTSILGPSLASTEMHKLERQVAAVTPTETEMLLLLDRKNAFNKGHDVHGMRNIANGP
jgi:hypothetical protein